MQIQPESRKPVILAVDDNPENLAVIHDFLSEYNYTVIFAEDGETAIERADYARPDLILLDIMMPGIDGYETCRQLKLQKSSCSIPVIFMSALSDTSRKVQGLEVGGVDYVTKPFKEEELLARVRVHLNICDLNRSLKKANELLNARVATQAEDLVFANKALGEEVIERQSIMARLIQTNRMTSLGLLVSSMAHEINNPNGAIRLDSNFLGKVLNGMVPALEKIACEDHGYTICGMGFDAALKEIFLAHKNIIHNSERIDSVIKDLRAYSLGACTPFVPNIDLNRVVSGALTIIRAHGHFTNATIREDLYPALPLICGSHYQLEQIVVNLLLNALQSLPYQGGKVTIATASSPDTREILITIRDTGEGIPPENIARLYEPFFSTRIETGGSGLGLYISNFIISEHGGRLEFESEVGIGTTVVMHLPLTLPDHSG
jgi:signal transduction histidine kinase